MPGVGTYIIAGLGVLIAAWGVISQRAIARRLATMNLLVSLDSDKALIDARKTFINLAATPPNLIACAQRANWSTQDAEAIRLVLNQFELVSIGIQRGVLDFEFYKRWYKSAVVRHWKTAHPFVVELRRLMKNELVYYEFQQLAGWMESDRRPPRSRLRGLIF
jgi:hypothetical protein